MIYSLVAAQLLIATLLIVAVAVAVVGHDDMLSIENMSNWAEHVVLYGTYLLILNLGAIRSSKWPDFTRIDSCGSTRHRHTL